MRILVCGGRDYADYEKVREVLGRICENYSKDPHGNWLPTDIVIIHGGATGADSLADKFAVNNCCQVKEFPADWKTHPRLAGHIRNLQMIKEGKPDLIVAFPGGNGTAHMMKLARAYGIELLVIQ